MPEILPEIMPEISLNGDKPHANGHGDVHFQSTAATITPNADAITMADSTAAAVCDAGAAVRALSLSSPKPSPAIVTLGATETTAATTATTTIMAGASKDTDKEVVSEANGIHVANGTTDYDGTMTPPPSSPGMMVKATEEVVSVDQVEQDLLAKLEELRKEKSRLFSLFRASLIKGQDMRSPEPPCAETSGSNMEEPTSRMSTTDMSGPRMIQALSLLSNGLSNSSLNGSSSLSREMNGSATAESADEVKKPSRTRKSSDQEYDKKPEPLRLNGKRREHGVIDRSKLNLEIPRKPSVCSMSSSSTTSSTPTPTSAGFAPPSSSSSSSSSYASKGKRPRSNSPTISTQPESQQQ
ncbi:hypothetical protein BGX31_010308 [Mortierella sp. GBA43]|nr:hypothetical protein BGX31_010308 [Mortierella sp. GBA43]